MNVFSKKHSSVDAFRHEKNSSIIDTHSFQGIAHEWAERSIYRSININWHPAVNPDNLNFNPSQSYLHIGKRYLTKYFVQIIETLTKVFPQFRIQINNDKQVLNIYLTNKCQQQIIFMTEIYLLYFHSNTFKAFSMKYGTNILNPHYGVKLNKNIQLLNR